MLTAGIASSDSSSSGALLAVLQQTGLIGTVKQWSIPMEKLPDGTEPVPDVILLDLGRDYDSYFTFGAHMRRLRPAVRLIACSTSTPPNHQLLLDAMRSGVQDFLSKPVNPEAVRQILQRFHQEGQAEEQRPAEKLIVVMGSKGGVGATTVAVNLGVHISTAARKKTVLLDFSAPLGNAHLLLDLHPRFGIRDAVDNLSRLDTHFFAGLLTPHKTKLEILGGALQPEEWQTIPIAPLERVVNVAQAGFDVVLADVGSRFSSDFAGMMQRARMILMVAEANVPALWALERRLAALSGFGVDPERIRVIVNRWHKGDEEILKSIEKNIKRPVFAFLPNDYRKASASANLGAPMIENHGNALGTRYRDLAAQITGMEAVPAQQKKSGIGNLFSFSTKG
jgi:pilus assembly protein CpaE